MTIGLTQPHLRVEMIPNRRPEVRETDGQFLIPVAVYGLHHAPELSMADTAMALGRTEVERLCGQLLALLERYDDGEAEACPAAGIVAVPDPARR
ncbi:hypothetical protein RM780_16840 [Streptomyces sp. DSM 44917]|uniref:Uncharacterized protein n=1 Tax=Streptomyces boetiae TaxID=3075541 RepID=A0ABU2LAL8_9ACTN|nr:hypothetical protein [Streptomyces sp. DSM 44917]MDT0308613.1 hypothetical protein [Streptomyces sp. DSM 44917]